ncbi:MAG: zinc ribbon domain-containing protein [Bacillota bacterium]|nr:zinc ribbon domain-containing protein [Bacillota bacterium]
MSMFENFTKKVTDTAKAAARKSSDLVEVTKLNMSIGTEEDKIEKLYLEIGKTIYESYAKDENIDDLFVEKCKQIDSYNNNIKEMRKKILELKNEKICPNCREELEIDVLYCSKCGAKQEIIEPEAEVILEEVPQKLCLNCNSPIEEDSLFCTKCGTKVE